MSSEAQQAILDETSIRPLQLLNELQTIYNKIAQQKNAIVHVKLDDNVPAVIEGDLLKITQVISNLCDNAIKFSPPGSLVDLECSIVDEKWVQMAVKDSGIGISYVGHSELLWYRLKRPLIAKRMRSTSLTLSAKQMVPRPD